MDPRPGPVLKYGQCNAVILTMMLLLKAHSELSRPCAPDCLAILLLTLVTEPTSILAKKVFIYVPLQLQEHITRMARLSYPLGYGDLPRVDM